MIETYKQILETENKISELELEIQNLTKHKEDLIESIGLKNYQKIMFDEFIERLNNFILEHPQFSNYRKRYDYRYKRYCIAFDMGKYNSNSFDLERPLDDFITDKDRTFIHFCLNYR